MSKYSKIDHLIAKYQEGDEQSAIPLVKAFESYINKFVSIIKHGSVNLKDEDTLKFISLFAQSKIRNAHKDGDIISKAVRSINDACFLIPEDDMRSELLVSFLEICKRYNRQNKINFCGFLYNTFRYEVYRTVKRLTKNPCVFSAIYNLPFDEGCYTENYLSTYLSTDDLSEPGQESDELWMIGCTCSEPFAALTQLERLILVCYYLEGYSDRDIAEETGFHRNTILSYRHQVEDSIAKYYGDTYKTLLDSKRQAKRRDKNN
jgi:hypothetical protein